MLSKSLFTLILTVFVLNANEININSNSKIFEEFKLEALKYDTSIPAYHYAYLNELLPKTIEKALSADDDECLSLLNQVNNLFYVEDAVGNFNIAKKAVDYEAVKCFKKLKEINYKFNEGIKPFLQSKIAKNHNNSNLKDMMSVLDR